MRYILLIAIFSSFTFDVFADFYADYLIMKNDDEIYSLYIYYWISSDDLSYNFSQANKSKPYDASLDLSLSLAGKEIMSWQLNSRISDPNNPRSVHGVRSISLRNIPRGKFLLRAKKSDGTEYVKKLTVGEKDRNYFIGGPLPLAYGEKVGSSSVSWSEEFRLGQYYLIPNAGAEYFGSNPSIPVYYELQNLPKEGKYFLKKAVLDGARRPLIIDNKEIDYVENKDYAEIDYVDCDNIATGVYYYLLELRDENANLIDKAEKKIYLTNYSVSPSMKNVVTEHMQFEMSEFVLMDEKTLKREFGKLKILLTDFEIEQYKELSLINAKRRALWSYWKNRDPDPKTVINERRVEFDKAVAYADRYFDHGLNSEGWRTERGRIALKYGLPSSREQHSPEGQLNACEVWFYDKLQGGVYFYFVDYYKNNNMILVHSTAYNERYDDGWVQKYRPALDDDQLPSINSLDNNRR